MCPKDSFPLPCIDQIVNLTLRWKMLSFMDAFSGYNQIIMYPPDSKKIVVIILLKVYCYKVMLFGLKNVGTTYQQLMNKIFQPILGKTIEVCLDDILIKRQSQVKHLCDLHKVFNLLRQFGMKLNPAKCAFMVSTSKFLGFFVIENRIEVYSTQVRVVQELPSPHSKKEFQHLVVRLATLARFISRYIDQLKPFFEAIQNAKSFSWIEKCETIFQAIKRYLTMPPISRNPQPTNILCVHGHS